MITHTQRITALPLARAWLRFWLHEGTLTVISALKKKSSGKAMKDRGPPRNEELRKAVRRARDEYLRISDELNLVVRETPSRIGGTPSPDDLQNIVDLGRQRAFAFERYLKALIEYKRLSTAGTQTGPALDRSESAPHLTAREREVLALIASGKTTKKIAATLGISFKTAVTHRSHLQGRLGVHNTADLLRAAVRMGLIELS